jgi:hypothetical protein
MTIYSDLTETTDYTDTYDYAVDSTEVYEEPSSSCCCSAEVQADDWPTYEPTSVYDDYPEDDASVWTDTPSAASAVIPAGQPGGPALTAVDPSWDTGQQDPYATNGFEHGFSSLGTGEATTGTGFSQGFGTGFSALASTPPSSFSTSDFGTGFSALDTTSASPFATTMTISNEVNPLGQLYAKAADQGDIMTQIQIAGIQASQARMTNVWLSPSGIW